MKWSASSVQWSTSPEYTVEDKIKYLQHATTEIDNTIFNSNAFNFLKNLTIQLQGELIRRFQTSNIFKLLELPVADKMREEDLNKSLSVIISNYKNGTR